MKNILKILASMTAVIATLLIFSITANADEVHTVQKGESLSKIAKAYYNDSNRWVDIYEANKDLIKDPNLIHIGWKLKIPDIIEKNVVKTKTTSTSRGKSNDILECKATAYDLSVKSCGKLPSHKAYGITASGRSIVGKTRLEAACVAVDPKVIPLGSLLYISFTDVKYQQYNGVYQALDTGSGVKGNHVDIFLGDFNSTKEAKEVLNFGVTKCKVKVLRYGW